MEERGRLFGDEFMIRQFRFLKTILKESEIANGKYFE